MPLVIKGLDLNFICFSLNFLTGMLVYDLYNSSIKTLKNFIYIIVTRVDSLPINEAYFNNKSYFIQI